MSLIDMPAWRLALILTAVVGLAPSAARAQSNDSDTTVVATDLSTSPNLDCSLTGLRIMAAEVSGARVECRLSGTSGSDSKFTVSAVLPSAPSATVPICAADLG